jgi:mono/diheme cytochrome c family protein
MKAVLRAFLVLVAALAVAVAVAAYVVSRRGLSTRVEPSAIETRVALLMRSWATPRAMKEARNPVPRTTAVLDDALAHFADHCAICHANDGSGQTDMGRNFYPPVPDMRAARTQGLADGELFSIIENGIRLTGMPAWGTGEPDGQRSSWALVHFIRHLPNLSAAEMTRIEALNPKTAEQFREEDEVRRFLAGDDDGAAAVPTRRRSGHH